MNPLFPLNEYIPDPEAHVFENRVYVYGSHDKEDGDRFCCQDYCVWSAPVDDLSNWKNHGISFKKIQDPRSKEDGIVDFYAPDCVKGKDGKYYLYYFAAGPNTKAFGPMSVAVSDYPMGPFKYLSDIKNKDGKPLLNYLTNDPTVINDNGRIFLYYGWGLGRDFSNKFFKPLYNFVLSKLTKRPLQEVKNTNPSILSCAVVELEDDMFTIKTEAKAVLDSKTTAKKDSKLYNHAFYEAPSIRKFNDLYYLVYSSGENNELCYATSIYPDKDFIFKGVIISNSDLGFKGNIQRKAPAGTIHGSIEHINGKYYVFYHRCTNNTDFSRQTCSEPIRINNDGSIEQVEITTQGISKPLNAKGEFPAAICCNLYNKNTQNVMGNGKVDKQPTITSKNNEMYLTSITDGTVISYKYFEFDNPQKISLTIRGDSGHLIVTTKLNEKILANIPLADNKDWTKVESNLKKIEGIHPLTFIYQGKGRIEIDKFTLE